MKALTWHGKEDTRCESVPDPRIEHPRDAIIKVSCCAICGSDLHLYDNMALGLAAVLGVTVLDLLCAEALRSEEADREARLRATRAYATRSGFPKGTQGSRGAARDFEPPADFRIPDPLRPWQAA